MGFVVFSLGNITIALSVRDENRSAFNRDFLADRRQLMLFGLSLLFIFVPVELGFPRFLGLTRLNGYAWLISIAFAIAVLLMDEVIKIVRRRRSKGEPSVAVPAPAQA